MKILFTAKGSEWNSEIDPRFGRAEYLCIVDSAADNLEVIDNTEISQYEHGAGPKTAEKIAKTEIDAIVTGNGPGRSAAMVLQHMNLKIYVGASGNTIKEAYERYKNNELNEFIL